MSILESLLGQLPDNALGKLQQFDRFWEGYRQLSQPIPTVVVKNESLLSGTDCDVAIAGGTLGIIVGCALQKRGWQVVLFEKGILRGRAQEWNIARRELEVILKLDLLTEQELETAIATEYNPGRIGFAGGKDIWVRDVLNLGVNPIVLLDRLKQKFLEGGGQILEYTELQQAIVHTDGVNLHLQSDGNSFNLRSRLLLDVMGHFSPIAAQCRQGSAPDGVCMVVGSCAQGIPTRDYGDLFYSFTPIQNACQYFWEAFPARDGRTTYMFTYADLHPSRPNFQGLFEDYFHWLPKYQDIDLKQLQLQRVLYGFFPSYRRSPLQTQWDRILQVGDSSGSQSPLSFGGFGALIRHLSRLTEGISEALQWNQLNCHDLRQLQPYQPNLSVTWLFQQAMRVPIGQSWQPHVINELLAMTFQTMENLGDPVLKPFLQDVVQFPALLQTMIGMILTDPILVAKVAGRVGLPALIDWMQHFTLLAGYDLGNRLNPFLTPLIRNLLPEQQFALNCQLKAWKYGSGGDFNSLK